MEDLESGMIMFRLAVPHHGIVTVPLRKEEAEQYYSKGQDVFNEYVLVKWKKWEAGRADRAREYYRQNPYDPSLDPLNRAMESPERSGTGICAAVASTSSAEMGNSTSPERLGDELSHPMTEYQQEDQANSISVRPGTSSASNRTKKRTRKAPANGDRFNMSCGNNHSVVLRFCKLLYTNRAKYIQWPREYEYQEIADQFRKFPNVVGAIDGTHVGILKPKNDDSYNNRKLTSSIQVQIVCDATKRIRDIFCGYPGSVHDARVWKDSPLYAYLSSAATNMPTHYHLLGDSAYPLDTFLMRPFRNNGNLTVQQLNYNTIHSSSRIIVENTIGLWKQKFRRMKFLEITNLKNAKFYIMASACLHNFIIEKTREENNDLSEDLSDLSISSTSSNDSVEQNDSDEEDARDAYPVNVLAETKRNTIAAILEQ